MNTLNTTSSSETGDNVPLTVTELVRKIDIKSLLNLEENDIVFLSGEGSVTFCGQEEDNIFVFKKVGYKGEEEFFILDKTAFVEKLDLSSLNNKVREEVISTRNKIDNIIRNYPPRNFNALETEDYKTIRVS